MGWSLLPGGVMAARLVRAAGGLLRRDGADAVDAGLGAGADDVLHLFGEASAEGGGDEEDPEHGDGDELAGPEGGVLLEPDGEADADDEEEGAGGDGHGLTPVRR